MNRAQRRRRRAAMAFWAAANPVARRLAGIVPAWVVLETTGRRSGRPRQVPLARGPLDGDAVTWVLAVHGRHSAFVRNIEAEPRVRLRMRARWRTGTATVEPMREDVLRRFSAYARSGRLALGVDPCLVRIELDG